MKLQEKTKYFLQTTCTKQSLNAGGPQLLRICISSSILEKTLLSTSYRIATFLCITFFLTSLPLVMSC